AHDVGAAGRARQAQHPMAGIAQPGHQARADQTGRTADEDLHRGDRLTDPAADDRPARIQARALAIAARRGRMPHRAMRGSVPNSDEPAVPAASQLPSAPWLALIAVFLLVPVTLPVPV